MTKHYGQCPRCYCDCFMDTLHEPNMSPEVKDKHPTDTDYGPGEDWTEVWHCHKCGTSWEEQNGYP